MEAHKIALLAGVSMLVGGTAAEAAVLTLPSQNFLLDAFDTSLSASDTDQLVFEQFDGSLGTLTQVTLTLDLSTLVGEGTVGGNTNPESSTTFTLDMDVTASFSAPNAGDTFPVLEFAAQCTASGLTGGVCSASDEASSNPFASIGLTGTDILAYIGASSVVVDFSVLISGAQSQSGEPGSFFESSVGADWDGTFTVAYTYDPAVEEPSVPEPATAALVGLGALALGAAARRRRS